MRTFMAINIVVLVCCRALIVEAGIMATHIYHNHMPNFWPYYDVQSYRSLKLGAPIRYAYDGQVIAYKKHPPAGWPLLQNGTPMPHNALLEGSGYYQHHAKWGAYQLWPWQVMSEFNAKFPLSQNHVTMSAAVINNVESLNLLQFPEFGDKYKNPSWGEPWRDSYRTRLTTHGFRSLDLIHFSGHHSMGPLVGNDYLLKDLIYHNATMAQDYFLGNEYKSSQGFFPTELGFSERIMPAQLIANMYYAYFDIFHDQLIDYYIDAIDPQGNRTQSEIQSVYVGAGRYFQDDKRRLIEDANGKIAGLSPFFSR